MDEVLIVSKTSRDTEVYLSGLSQKTLFENGITTNLSDLFLYEMPDDMRNGGIRVLASVPDLDAGYRLLEMIG